MRKERMVKQGLEQTGLPEEKTVEDHEGETSKKEAEKGT